MLFSKFLYLTIVQRIQRSTDSLSRTCHNTFQPLCCQQHPSILSQISREKMVSIIFRLISVSQM